MLTAIGLAGIVRKETDCLWKITGSIIAGTHTEADVEEGRECYKRLERALARYHEERLDVLDSAYIWFSEKVVDAFSEVYERYIAHAA